MGILMPLRRMAFRIHKKLETRQHRLLYLFFEITRRCNLSCVHCGSDCSRDQTIREMTLESWVSIMDYVKHRYDPFIVLAGGEPLVRSDIVELTAALRERNLRWGMVTNGMALDDRALASLLGNGLSSITVSLDGLREQHVHIRRHPRSYDRALRALRLLGQTDIEHKDVVTCVYPANLHALDHVAEVLVNSGITSWRLFRIFPKGSAARHPELMLDYNQSRQLLTWIAGRRPLLRERGLDVSFSCEGYLPFSVDLRVRGEPFFCRAGINIASILSDGTITGCNNNGEQYYQGNVAYDDLDQVWTERFAEYRDRTWMKTWLCRACREWTHCLGSSIHLKDKDTPGPGFCYVHDVPADTSSAPALRRYGSGMSRR